MPDRWPISGSGNCVVCGCTARIDEFGDRICWCDTCQTKGCFHDSAEYREWIDRGASLWYRPEAPPLPLEPPLFKQDSPATLRSHVDSAQLVRQYAKRQVRMAGAFPPEQSYAVTEKVDGVGLFCAIHPTSESPEPTVTLLSSWVHAPNEAMILAGELAQTPLGPLFVIQDVVTFWPSKLAPPSAARPAAGPAAAHCGGRTPGHGARSANRGGNFNVSAVPRLSRLLFPLNRLTLLQRMEAARALLNHFGKSFTIVDSTPYGSNSPKKEEFFGGRLSMTCKEYHPLHRALELLQRSHVYKTDGLIFAPTTTSRISTLPTLKWKPLHKLTVDLEVRPDRRLWVHPSNRNDEEMPLSRALQRTPGLSAVPEMLDPVTFARAVDEFPQAYDSDPDSLYQWLRSQQSAIAELLWNRIAQRWVFVRWRPDRNTPNGERVTRIILGGRAAAAMQTTWDGMIALHEERRGAPSARPTAFTHYNKAVKSVLYSLVACRTDLLDLAAGPIKDLQLWRAAGVRTVVAVDNDRLSIHSARSRLKSSPEPGGPSVHVVEADLNRMPAKAVKWCLGRTLEDAQFDVIVCNFAIHYFINADLSHILRLLKPGGHLIVTFMESEKVRGHVKTPNLTIRPLGGFELEVTVRTIGRAHVENRVSRASLADRMDHCGLRCTGFLPFASFEHIVNGVCGPESDLFCCGIFKRKDPDDFSVEKRLQQATNYPITRAMKQRNIAFEESSQHTILTRMIWDGRDSEEIDVLLTTVSLEQVDPKGVSALEWALAYTGVLREYHSGPSTHSKEAEGRANLNYRPTRGGDGDIIHEALAVLDVLLIHNADLNCGVLEYAIEHDFCLVVVERLLRRGALFESTPEFIERLCSMSSDVIPLFHAHGLDVHVRRENGETALMTACRCAEMYYFTLFEEYCARIERSERASPVFHRRLVDAFPEAAHVHSLLMLGCNPMDCDDRGRSAWDYAQLGDAMLLCRYLVTTPTLLGPRADAFTLLLMSMKWHGWPGRANPRVEYGYMPPHRAPFREMCGARPRDPWRLGYLSTLFLVAKANQNSRSPLSPLPPELWAQILYTALLPDLNEVDQLRNLPLEAVPSSLWGYEDFVQRGYYETNDCHCCKSDDEHDYFVWEGDDQAEFADSNYDSD
eukprot:m.16505 g.16505  ORF g.16505 m.16505 type:complete len:1140 (+) comp5056_c0_seq1:254-3673(+)